MITQQLKNILRNYYYLKGWHTRRKLLIIESDDWGSIRMSSKSCFNRLLKKGYPLANCAYNKNDALESNADMESLLDALNSVRDKNGNPAKMTINNVVANPDFEKIRNSDFKLYFYETFDETLKKYPKHDKVISLYKEGIRNSLLQPQFHGREHVHVNNWLQALKKKEKPALDAFQENMFSIFQGWPSSCNKEFLDAMATYSQTDIDFLHHSIKDGVNIFNALWGYKPKTIIPSCYTWHPIAENIFYENNFNTIQTGWIQAMPRFNNNGVIVKRRYTGEQNQYGMYYTNRNVFFEPSSNPSLDWVYNSLRDISKAFFWRKPAIISSHRLNYIGFINEENRSSNIKLVKTLLKEIIRRWPDVEFIASEDLVKIMHKKPK